VNSLGIEFPPLSPTGTGTVAVGFGWSSSNSYSSIRWAHGKFIEVCLTLTNDIYLGVLWSFHSSSASISLLHFSALCFPSFIWVVPQPPPKRMVSEWYNWMDGLVAVLMWWAWSVLSLMA
jgi:hypothetical protein